MIIDGFTYSAVSAGIRKKDRLDLGLIYCERPAVAGGVFTTSLVKAAPVLLGVGLLLANAGANFYRLVVVSPSKPTPPSGPDDPSHKPG